MTIELAKTDGVTSSNPVVLHPDFTMIEAVQMHRSEHTTIGGRDSYHKYSQFTSWRLSLIYVPDSDTQQINEWQQTSERLLFVTDVNTTTEINEVRITNRATPLPRQQRPYTDLFQGEIMLETLVGSL